MRISRGREDGRHSGFTLVELLIVIVIVGILAAIAIPKYSAMKERARVAEIVSDLRNVATAQESYLHDHNTYAADASALYPMFEPTVGNTLTIAQATSSGWSAKVTSTHTTKVCAVFVNTTPLAPATKEGVATCE